MALVMSFTINLSQNKLRKFDARVRTVEILNKMCSADNRKEVYLPMSKDGHWGYFLIKVNNKDCIVNGSSIIWGDSSSQLPSTYIFILKTCFPSAPFSTIEGNFYRDVVGGGIRGMDGFSVFTFSLYFDYLDSVTSCPMPK